MKKFIKITLIVIAALFILLIILGYFVGNSMNGIIAKTQGEAEGFAKTASKEQCLERYVDKYSACEEFSCYASSASFGIICLAAASDDKNEFCSDKPKSQFEFYKGDWKDGLCKSKGLDTSSCLSVYKIIETHCAS